MYLSADFTASKSDEAREDSCFGVVNPPAELVRLSIDNFLLGVIRPTFSDTAEWPVTLCCDERRDVRVTDSRASFRLALSADLLRAEVRLIEDRNCAVCLLVGSFGRMSFNRLVADDENRLDPSLVSE